MTRRRLHITGSLLTLVTLACSVPVRAAVSIYPSELYGGMNVVSIDASSGVRRIQYNDDGRWIDMRSGRELSNLRIASAPTPRGCVRRLNVYLFVPDVTRSAEIEMRVIECDGSTRYLSLETSEEWEVDHQRMRDARVGETVCQPFSVRSTRGAVTVDRVVSPSGSFELRFTGRRPPVRIASGRAYVYQVCFTATKPGRHKMPIHVYIRREQPNGGFTSFIVADTAYVNVIGPPPPQRPLAQAKPRPRPVRPPARPARPAPRVRVEPARPVEPPPPPRMPDVGTVEARAVARAVVPIETEALRALPDAGSPVGYRPELTDPTTFRTVVLPTARSVPEGQAFIASYDLAGVLLGYGATDRLTLLLGGAYIPEAVGSWTVDVTAGARYEIHRGDFTRVAAGLQLNHSDTDSSAITLAAPYVVASIGDDDRRASLALSYSARRHDPTTGDPFSREAIVLAAGGDVRIGGNWKLAGEAYWIQHSSYQPVIATVRYFGQSFAVDAGVAVNATGDDPLVAPMLSLVWVFSGPVGEW